MSKSPDTPNLQNSVKRLKTLSKSLFNKSPKEVGEVYLAAVGLLVHLTKDQATIHSQRSQNGQNHANFPSAEEIPAISAVLYDETLFGALVRCLNSGASVGGEGPSGSEITLQGRKRGLSISGESMSNKALKLTHSPMPSRTTVMENRRTAHKTPTFKLPVLVATILYTSFAYIDHWPVPLVEAYAVDCFGPRIWVDDSDCALLVQNISTSITNKGERTEDETDAEAGRVAKAYEGFSLEEQQEATGEQNIALQTSSTESNHPQRRPSISSVTSHVSSSKKSDSGVEDCSLNKISAKKSTSKKSKDSSYSSSSGEEDSDADVAMSESLDDESSQKSKSPKEPPHRSSSNGSMGDFLKPLRRLYPVSQRYLNLERVRARYFGLNLDAAHNAVSSALRERVGQRSKQNSSLLQAIPSFTSIPRVRVLATAHLEKWLQSPALAGLSRALFTATVQNMKNADPPLPEDLQAIDSILAMQLKANQFAAHVENVTEIANRIPTATVANHMYSQLLKGCLRGEASHAPSEDSLSMVAAIHKTLPPQISYEAFAASLLMILAHGDGADQSVDAKKSDQMRLIRRLRKLVRALASKLGASFDGFQLLAALLELDVSEDKWSIKDEEDKARLMFQCVTLHVARVAGVREISKSANWKTLLKSQEVEESVRVALRKSRRMLLQWCCNDYGPSYSRRRKKKHDSDILEGGVTPDFVSAIGPDSQEESIPPWLNTMRCLLMIEDVDSELMTHFLAPADGTGQTEEGWIDEKERIALCANFGADVDDDMIGVILKSSGDEEGGLSADMSLKLLEHLFESCGKRKGAALRVSNPDLVWEMYKLAHYTPSHELVSQRVAEYREADSGSVSDFANLPRLAYTGLWWRVTVLGLVLCGSNPSQIGSVVWKDHPTLSALIKMVTSTKYRFPTVDCDESLRERMKQEEQAARDNETRVAELLFLPPKKKLIDPVSKRLGSRVSRRLLKQQQEKETAAELAETNRRRKLLRSAQKCIMLWDPDGPARKPPRESAELLVSAESLFNLANAFQRCTSPDFLLHTIGGTTRGAIERAYDWLIPIISRLPETISRLPSSTSCFLLLRAYGTDGERRAQLKELSTPLLHHVQDSLRGTLGEAESTEAFDILLSDVASHHSERRKSARRVLNDALGAAKGGLDNTKPGVSQWMLNIVRVDYARAVVPIAMARLSTAAQYERGKVLKSIIVALQSHISFAKDNGIEVTHRFPLLLSLLVSQRPNVYAEAIDAFPDFRSLVIRVIYDEIRGDHVNNTEESIYGSSVSIALRTDTNGIEEKLLPESLLHTTCILLSVWSGEGTAEAEDTRHIQSLVDALMIPNDDSGKVEQNKETIVGLASAVNAETKATAMTVDSWIMMCKARNDSIGKRAALSAPEDFLGRLLLSSGLPRISLLAMMERISKVASSSTDMDSAYRNLLVPSASSEWDIGRVGSSYDVARRLLGRLSAYLHAGTLDETSSGSFVQWLQKECHTTPFSPKKRSPKILKTGKAKAPVSVPDFSAVLSSLGGPSDVVNSESIGPAVHVSDLDCLLSSREYTTEVSDILENLTATFSKESPQELHDLLEKYSAKDDKDRSPPTAQVTTHLARQIEELGSKPRWAVTALLRWVPLLSKEVATPDLWCIVFAKQDDLLSLFLDELILLCIQWWSRTHIRKCTAWIESMTLGQMKIMSARRFSDFLVKTSKLAPPELEVFSETSLLNTNPEWGTSEAHAAAIVKVCIEAAVESSEKEPGFDGRNSPPSWLILLEMLGNRGKKQLVYLTDTLLRFQIENSESICLPLLDVAILRLYLLFPTWMNVGSSPVRMALLRASEAYASSWVIWRSSLDDILDEAIQNVFSGEPRAPLVLSEHARKHPLLILRKTANFIAALEEDAGVRDVASESRGIVQGRSIAGPAEAFYQGKAIKVHVIHWGYSYTESLWNVVLDIFMGIPKEVMFQCGLKLGFLELLNIFLKLLSVQLHLLTGDATNKLKSKFAEVLKVFGQVNSVGYRAWWGTLIDGYEVRNSLVSCDLLSPQEAIESIRAANR